MSSAAPLPHLSKYMLFSISVGEERGQLWGNFLTFSGPRLFIICLKTGSSYVVQADLELGMLLPQPLQCWDYRYEPIHPASEP